MDEKGKFEKPANPRAKANPFSALTFWWILPTFWTGYRRDLGVHDLFVPLKEHKSDELGDKFERVWNEEVEKASQKSTTPSLLKVIVRIFGAKCMLYGLLLFATEIFIRVTQPLFLGRFIEYFHTPTNITTEAAYWYAAGIVVCSAFNIFVVHPYMMGVFHTGMKIRVGCCSLIYRKALRLSKTALGDTTAGQVVNLLSNDVNRFDFCVLFFHYLWIGPIETMIVSYFIWNEVGWSGLIGVCTLLMFIPLQAYLGNKASVYRLKTALRTDERVRLMNEIISGIQVIKMYTWEKPFAKLVKVARRNEIAYIRATSYIKGIMLSFIMFTTRTAIFVTFLCYVLFKNEITAEKVFVVTSYYNILRQTMTVFFPQGIYQVAEGLVSVKRLQKFLLYDETTVHQPTANEIKTKKEELSNSEIISESIDLQDIKEDKLHTGKESVRVLIEKGSAKWVSTSQDPTLLNIDLSVRAGELLAVVGAVGSGKTSLLHLILKELPLTSGKLTTEGKIAYASQDPWLFAGSIRQNILFGQPYDKKRYREVVRVCSLKRDFELFPHRDKTIVGERGISLSGGQRARINLARAVYLNADIYLLDDPLSAVDAHVGKHLFDDCIKGHLKNKAVILVTHQLQHLVNADKIILLKNGEVDAFGSFKQLKEKDLAFLHELKEPSYEDQFNDDKSTGSTPARTSVGSITSIDDKSLADPEQVEEQRSSGSIKGNMYGKYFSAGGSWFVIFLLFFMSILAQLAAIGADYWITYWTNLEQERAQNTPIRSNFNETRNDLKEINATSVESSADLFENSSYGLPSMHRFDNVANPSADSKFLSTEICIYIFTAVSVAVVVISISRSFLFFAICMRASVRLHDQMFNCITRATMRFFNTNPSGRILNRFSKDMGAIDENLPMAMIDTLQIGLALIGIIFLVALVNYWILIPTAIIGIIFYLLRIIYLATSRSIKRLEGITRSPVFSHLNASLQGLTTIRAFQAQAILEKEFDNHQDLHSSAWFIFIVSSRAFGFWLDIVCLIYIALVTFSFFIFNDNVLGGDVGLAITQAIGLTGMFQWGMRQSAEMENQMTSVERVIEYTEVEQEPALESSADKKPSHDWPNTGRIEFQNVYLRYSKTDEPVLKNLNLTFNSQEKIGIVGRTGAGKSSLISALFRLAEIEGTIKIDCIDASSIGLHDLRGKISIIPQEPVLFSGTMRKNLDPFEQYNDDTLWQALEEVELKDAVNELPAGLSSKISEGGSNFSVGQRQLVCLARAIIRNNRILVLDEATANVDPHTDALIQKTIRQKFAECTVLTIAHRLHTVMDNDKILVMDAGVSVEYDQPYALLSNKNSHLYRMAKQTGHATLENLIEISKVNYKN